jgi:hypothetical protein
MSSHHHVVRIDIEPDEENPHRSQTHGWQVRVSFRGIRRTKFFADQKYGGREEALELAVAYRDTLLAEREAMHEAGPVERRAQKRSSSGVAGVRLAFKNEIAYVEANWVRDGNRSVSSYSVDRWGLRKAVWQACKARALGRGISDPKRIQSMFDIAFPNVRERLEGRSNGKAAQIGHWGDGTSASVEMSAADAA